MKRLALTLAALALLAGCQPKAVAGTQADTGCPAASLQSLVGMPESAAHDIDYSGPIRVIHPGEAVTMDFSPDRLDIEIGDNGLIARVRCG